MSRIARSRLPILVARAARTPDNEYIEPRPMSQARNGVVDARAANPGVIRATVNPEEAAFHAARAALLTPALLRLVPDGGYGGQAFHYVEGAGKRLYLATDEIKHAWRSLGAAPLGHIHLVEGDPEDGFVHDPTGSPDSRVSGSRARVIGSYVVYNATLEVYFGPHLERLEDPAKYPDVIADMQATRNSDLFPSWPPIVIDE